MIDETSWTTLCLSVHNVAILKGDAIVAHVLVECEQVAGFARS